jgi:hypothetical protein
MSAFTASSASSRGRQPRRLCVEARFIHVCQHLQGYFAGQGPVGPLRAYFSQLLNQGICLSPLDQEARQVERGLEVHGAITRLDIHLAG